MAAIKKIEERTLQFIEAHAQLKEAGKMVTHEELARIIGAESKTTITEILKQRQNIQPKQWDLFRKHFKLSTEYSVPRENEPDIVANFGNQVFYIVIKTASGKDIKIKPEGKEQTDLLNAFLEERDRVINTLKEEKQARIDELIKDKTDLFKLLNSNLGDITRVQQAIFAMVRTLQDYAAWDASQGNEKKKLEMMNTLSKLNADNLHVDAKQDSAVHLSKSNTGF